MVTARVLFIGLVGGLIFERLFEIRAGRRNMVGLLARGGHERSGGHYPVIVVMHACFFISMIAEFLLRGGGLAEYWPWFLGLFIAGQLLRLWSRLALGRRWTARIVTVPGEVLVTGGPYRFLSHPIYVAVAIELLALPLIAGLWCTATVFTLLNAIMLLAVRIPAEERALVES